MSACERIQSHLSALADGELLPLEAVAIRRHLHDCARCAREVEGIEGLKLQVHVAGTEARPTPGQVRAWRVGVADALAAQAQERRRPWLWAPVGVMAAAAAAAAAVIMIGGLPAVEAPEERRQVVTVTPPQPVPEVAVVEAQLDADALARMARVHRAEASPSLLDDLVQAGALTAFERLPQGFITREGERVRLVQARHVDCDLSQMGSSLAVLRTSALRLPEDVDQALDEGGVHLSVVGGVEVRVSRSGDQVFVLLSEPPPQKSQGAPI